MLPRDLKSEQFSGYAPEARKFITNYIGVLQRLPLSFVPNLLREVIDYDYKFPAERKQLETELNTISKLPEAELKEWFKAFEAIQISPALEKSDWVNAPAQFVEQLSEFLWSTHQTDAFRAAAIAYEERKRKVAPAEAPALPRLGITVIGQGVSEYREPLFRRLRPHGAYFSGVNPERGLAQLLEIVSARAKEHASPYGHWYLDGGEAAAHDAAIACVSYSALAPMRALLSKKMRGEIERPGMGPEALRTTMAKLRPADLGFGPNGDIVFDYFQLKLLTEGSGTQVFSTTFAQWAARELLRRAQPLTLLVRFAPRQRQRPMNELIYNDREAPEVDLVGSLIDGDMGAYYNWLNQQRLAGAEKSSFIVWFEGHNQAVAIGPTLPRGTQSNAPTEMKQLASWAI